MKNFFLLLTLLSLTLKAQVTGTALKAQIDTNITNKTGVNSITKANVGNSLKGVVDYVDQQIATVSSSALTRGAVVATTPGANLIYDINEVSTTGSFQNLIIPQALTFSMGKEILIYKSGGYDKVYLNSYSGDFILKYNTNNTTVELNYDGIYRLKKVESNKWLIDRMTQEDEVRVYSDGETILGNGSSSDIIRLGFGKLLRKVYAAGSSNPTTLSNYQTGQYLPAGVTVSFVRVSTGMYEFKIIGDATLPVMDCTGSTGRNIFFTIHNSNTLNYGGQLYSDSSGVRTITYSLTNYVGGVLTDGFNSGEIVEINFYAN